MSVDEWQQVSRVLDFIMAQKKESPGVTAIRGMPEKSRQKPKKDKKEPPAEQLRINTHDSEEVRNLKALIREHKSRLYILRKQEAVQGITADPKVPIEIKDIESKIRKIQRRIRTLEGQSGKTTS